MGEISRSVNETFIPTLLDEHPGLKVLKGGTQEAEAQFFSEIGCASTPWRSLLSMR